MEQITLGNLKDTLDKAQADEATQNAYVLTLGTKIQAGEKTIEVFSDNVWTTVKLLDFWQLQYDKYLAMAGYAGDLVTLYQKLSSDLTTALLTILLPEDRVQSAKQIADTKAEVESANEEEEA